MRKVQVWTGIAALAMALGLIYAANSLARGDDVAAARGDILKIAEAVKSGDMSGAKKLAAAAGKKHELEPVMDAFKRKDKEGIGFGAGPKEKDGIEAMYRDIGGAAGGKPKEKDAALFETMAHNTIAVGLIAEAKTPTKDEGKKTVKGWKQANQDMLEGAQALAAAAKAKNMAGIQKAATKVNAACNACHSEHRNN
jgi:hypothetical protein